MGKELYLLKVGDLYGYIDYTGEIVIEPMYKNANDFSDDIALVTTADGKKKFINEKNEELFTVDFEGISSFNNGYAFFRKDGKTGFINKNGEIEIQPEIDWVIKNFDSNSLSIVEVKEKWGVIDKSGDFVVEPIYEGINDFGDGLMSARLNGKAGFIDINGNVKIDFKFTDVGPFSEGIAIASIDGEKYGYIDNSGEFIIQPEYYNGFDFKDGLAAVTLKLDGRWGFINKEGELVIKNKYITVDSFSEGLAVAEYGKGIGYINTNGKVILKHIFNSAYSFKNSLGLVTYKGEWGYVNKEGEFVYKPKSFDLW
ncbi:WG repeat-containing protein [Clostridium sp. SHJSY1]|uniref:WG repeat-containing protein n=1 Tax=Clostridium sp. SHJSY1 TaxID=2942483 RepID=UPI002875D486|nr:WG repeat-containing protein [Clostridium sp. SHJSY1]MDS0527578.1 WG repeat-containing protein [Clostridium sp. SHJSY1]